MASIVSWLGLLSAGKARHTPAPAVQKSTPIPLLLVKYLTDAAGVRPPKGVPGLKIVERIVGEFIVIDITGDIDLSSSPDLRKVLLRELKEKRTPRVIVNLAGVRYIDSSGVASLVEGLKASRDTGLRFALVGLSKGAREVLQLSRLIKIFEIHDNEEQALA
jgi:anti-sigma B factor antagonist